MKLRPTQKSDARLVASGGRQPLPNAECRMASSDHSSSVIRHSKLSAAFTLAEVLAALAFMAIVIPVVVECLHIATRAGEVAQRKSEAARVAERVLNESVVTGSWNQSDQNGTVEDGQRRFDWTLQNQPWNQDPMRLLTVQVKYTVQGRDYSVQLSTLTDGSASSSTNSSASN
jgi:type II secretory pathway pseudopilin PulG